MLGIYLYRNTLTKYATITLFKFIIDIIPNYLAIIIADIKNHWSNNKGTPVKNIDL